ncbi:MULTISPECIES: DNA-3-methyladenine glycosylase family protein [Mycetohabitans]|uniref:DNA-3-methyladenine glycosylase II n=1 Tax=Mycetohabitans endofungorum TaxID=417203 RepID=A0A2P5KBC9_9BURK|nr:MULTISPECIES: DNA-3-methyladenine glycosylase [Mycetohabitans]PPB83945.1 DNA-3-methyladenine glycosylase II [Mycetohabitans endofungorum]
MATAKRAARSTEAKAPPDAATAAAKRGAARARVARANGLEEDATLRHVARAASNAEPARKATAPASEASVPAASQERGAAVSRPEYWDRACADLVRRDRILKKLIPQFGPVHLMARGDPFVTLARSIVGQQISVGAAQAIWARLVAACPSIAPSRIVKLGQPRLIECGLSKRKSEYILDLAQHFTSGALHIASWASMDDEAVIGELTQIRGIGRWTAEMFLIFNLMRPNVLPLDDLGLIRAISVNYFSGEPVTRSEAREVAANWEPWRTVATWYMWRSLEPLSAQA